MMAFTKWSNTGQRKGKPEREEKLEHEINTPVNVTSVEGRMIQNDGIPSRDGSDNLRSEVWEDEATRERRKYRLDKEMSDYDNEEFKNYEVRTKQSNPTK